MKITIDTSKDSKDEIKKTVDFLMNLVNSASSMPETSINQPSEQSSGFMDMFSDNSQSNTYPTSIEKKEENETEEESKIIPY